MAKARPWLENWAAAFTLTMKAQIQGSVAPEASLLGPFGAGSYILPIGVGVGSDGTRTTTSKYTMRLNSLRSDDRPKPGQADIQGALAIEEWLLSIIPDREDATFRIPDTLGHTQQFILSASGHVDPSFALIRSKGQADFGIGRFDTDILDIAMTDASTPPPQRVVIVGSEPAPANGRTNLFPKGNQGMFNVSTADWLPSSPSKPVPVCLQCR